MKNNKLIFLLLIVGLLLSSSIRIVFNLSHGFEFQDFWITFLPLQMFDLAWASSNELLLTSTVLGYVVYLLAGLVMFKKRRDKKNWVTLFIIISFLSIAFETASFIQDINGTFSGQHLRIGPSLFLVGLFVLGQDYLGTTNNRNSKKVV